MRQEAMWQEAVRQEAMRQEAWLQAAQQLRQEAMWQEAQSKGAQLQPEVLRQESQLRRVMPASPMPTPAMPAGFTAHQPLVHVVLPDTIHVGMMVVWGLVGPHLRC